MDRSWKTQAKEKKVIRNERSKGAGETGGLVKAVAEIKNFSQIRSNTVLPSPNVWTSKGKPKKPTNDALKVSD